MGLVLSVLRDSRTKSSLIALVVICLTYLRVKKLRSKHVKLLGFEGKRPAPNTVIGHVKRLSVFPIKSAKPLDVESAEVSSNGFDLDRRVMIVNKAKVPVTQRMKPELALIRVEVISNNLFRLIPPADFADLGPLDLDCKICDDESKSEWFDLHTLHGQCVSFGEKENEWINKFFSKNSKRTASGFRFVCILPSSYRRIHTSPVFRALTVDSKAFDSTHLSDMAPLSFVNEASFKKLKTVIKEGTDDMHIDRFRSNIVMDASEDDLAFLEDEIQEIQVGPVRLRSIGPTFRCVIPSINQQTAEAGFRDNIRTAEPIKTLRSLHSGGMRFGLTGLLPAGMGGSKGLAPIFGVYMGVSEEGIAGKIKQGDEVKILKYREPPGLLLSGFQKVTDYFGLGSAIK